jgi:hypothetical protein
MEIPIRIGKSWVQDPKCGGQALHDPVASPLEANENIRNECVLFGIGHSNSFQSFEESSVDRLSLVHGRRVHSRLHSERSRVGSGKAEGLANVKSDTCFPALP